jgi:hypothetical protein
MLVFEVIGTAAPMNAREAAPCEVVAMAAPLVIDRPASPFPHQIGSFPWNGQPVPGMMTAPGRWMFHPENGWGNVFTVETTHWNDITSSSWILP